MILGFSLKRRVSSSKKLLPSFSTTSGRAGDGVFCGLAAPVGGDNRTLEEEGVVVAVLSDVVVLENIILFPEVPFRNADMQPFT